MKFSNEIQLPILYFLYLYQHLYLFYWGNKGKRYSYVYIVPHFHITLIIKALLVAYIFDPDWLLTELAMKSSHNQVASFLFSFSPLDGSSYFTPNDDSNCKEFLGVTSIYVAFRRFISIYVCIFINIQRRDFSVPPGRMLRCPQTNTDSTRSSAIIYVQLSNNFPMWIYKVCHYYFLVEV